VAYCLNVEKDEMRGGFALVQRVSSSTPF